MTTGGPVARLAEWLEREHGMRFDGPGLGRLERGLTASAAEAGRSLTAHAEAVTEDVRLLRDLLERVTVHETSWFRDASAFAALEHVLLPAAAARARAAGRPVRAWSAGCAHGQEAWSLAVLAAEQGVDLDLLATDISRPAVLRAEAGVYADRELRGLGAARRSRFLEPTPDGGHRVRDRLRAGVRFATLDLVGETPPLPEGGVDLILCRYVLIYLSSDASAAVLERFARLLAPGGRLLVGGAESLWHLTDRFAVQSLDGAFAYGVAPTAAAAPPEPVRVPEQALPALVERRRRARSGPLDARATAETVKAEASPLPERDALLAAGEAAVAAGDLRAAVTAFRGAAYVDPDSPVAHLQLGLALEQLEDPGARRAFRAAWAAIGRTGADGLAGELDGWRAEELVRLVGTKLGAIR